MAMQKMQAAWLADLLNSVTASEPEEPLPELHPVQPIEDVMDVVLGEAHYYHPQPMYPPIALGGSSADSVEHGTVLSLSEFTALYHDLTAGSTPVRRPLWAPPAPR